MQNHIQLYLKLNEFCLERKDKLYKENEFDNGGIQDMLTSKTCYLDIKKIAETMVSGSFLCTLFSKLENLGHVLLCLSSKLLFWKRLPSHIY